jgi:hypothetical protein
MKVWRRSLVENTKHPPKKKKIKKVFIEKVNDSIVVDSTVYDDDDNEFRKILEQTQNPALTIDLFLCKSFGEAFKTEDLHPTIKAKLTKLVNTELNKDTQQLTDKETKKVKKIARKLKRGEQVYRYPKIPFRP